MLSEIDDLLGCRGEVLDPRLCDKVGALDPYGSDMREDELRLEGYDHSRLERVFASPHEDGELVDL